MLSFKTKSPITGSLVALAFLVGLYLTMENILQQSQVETAPELPEAGRSILAPELLAPFADKWSTQDPAKSQEALAKIGHDLQTLTRRDFEGYLAVNLGVEQLEASLLRYVGQALPLKFESAGQALGSGGDGFAETRKMSLQGRDFTVHFVKAYSGNLESPCYAEVIFLGMTNSANATVKNFLGAALELHELPMNGQYPRLESDAMALNLIVDDMKTPRLQEMTRNVSPQAMSHFFSKIQAGECEKMPLIDTNYTQLMETPERFRAQKVSFTGTLIFKKKNRLHSENVPPGMDIYEEGFLLNSDQISYVFRAPQIPPHIRIKDIVHIEGYFLQRYNYLNRLNRATWTPLILASKIEKEEEKKISLTDVEKTGVFSVLGILGLGFVWIVMRKPKIRKVQRLHKSLHVKKVDSKN
jgi:hypothetical protein